MEDDRQGRGQEGADEERDLGASWKEGIGAGGGVEDDGHGGAEDGEEEMGGGTWLESAGEAGGEQGGAIPARGDVH